MIIGMLSGLCFGIILCLWQLVDSKFIKEKLIALTNEKTGHILNIESDINWSLFPDSFFQIQEASLNSSGNPLSVPLLSLESGSIAVDSVSLLSNKFKVKHFRAKGLTINLIRDEHGVSNWRDLFDFVQKNHDQEQSRLIQNDLPTNLTLSIIEEMRLEDGEIVWHDFQNNRHLIINKFHFYCDIFSWGKPAIVQISAAMSGQTLKFPGSLKWSAVAKLDAKQQHITLTENQIELYGFNSRHSPDSLLATIKSPQIKVNLNRESIEASTITWLQDGLNFRVEDINVEKISTEPLVYAAVNIDVANPVAVANSWDIKLPSVHDENAFKKWTMKFKINGNKDGVSLNELDGLVDDTHVAGSAEVKSFSQPKLEFNLTADAINLNRYLPVRENQYRPSIFNSGLSIQIPQPPSSKILGFWVEGKLQVGQLLFNEIEAKIISIDLSTENSGQP